MKRKGSGEPYYDLCDDWALIVASLQSEYGIRISRELDGMSWQEFSAFINGLSGESPLGRVIAIRSENRSEVLKEFTPEQHKLRNEYRRKQAKQKPQKEVENAIEQFRKAFMSW